MENLRIAKELVRLAKSLVAMTHEEKLKADGDFPGLAVFFMHCLHFNVPEEKQDAFVELLRKPGQNINESDYERFTNVNLFEFGKTAKWLDYLGLIDFSTLNDFNNFIDNYTTRQNYATNAQTSPDILALLAYDENYKVSDAALENDSFPVDKMMEIVENGNDRMKMNIACKKNAPSNILEKLSYDGNEFIRARVASHENTPVNVLERMLDDSNPDVLSSIASNKKTPGKLLVKLAELVDTFSQNEQNWLRRIIANNPNTPPETLEGLVMNHKYDDAFDMVALNQNTPLETLHKMIEDSRFIKKLTKSGLNNVFLAVASNPKADLDLIRKIMLKTSDPRVQKVISKRNDLPSDMLDILAGSKEPDVRINVAGHSNASVETLTRLSRDRIVSVRLEVLQNPNTTPEIYGNLAGDQNVNVRIEVADSKKTPPDVLRLLSNDTIWNVRAWVANNSNTPLDVLMKLSKSKVSIIRQYAIANINRRTGKQIQ